MPASSRYARTVASASVGGAVGGGLVAHGMSAGGAWTTAAKGSMGVGVRTRRASAYTSRRWSVVAPQPKSLACTAARRPRSPRRAVSTRSDSTASVQVADVVALDEQPGVADGHRQAADIRGDDRGAAGLGLQRHQAERLAVRGHEDEIGGAVPLGQQRPRHRRDEPGLVGDAELGGERLEVARAGEAGTAGPTEDGEHEVVAPLRVTAEQLGSDAQQHVGPFEGLDAADEEQDPTVAGQPERFTRRVGVARGERREVDAGGDDAHLGRVGVVELDEVAPPRPRCSRRAGRRPRRPGPRRSRGQAAPGCRRSAGDRFLTRAMVCIVWTSGTPHRSAASQPTWPDSQ